MYLCHVKGTPPATVLSIAQQFNVSRDHLVKVVHSLSKQGLIKSTKGRYGGGIQLAHPPSDYLLGDLIKMLEGHAQVIDCKKTQCPLIGLCELSRILNQTLDAFYTALNQYSLEDACLQAPTNTAIINLIQSFNSKTTPITSP